MRFVHINEGTVQWWIRELKRAVLTKAMLKSPRTSHTNLSYEPLIRTSHIASHTNLSHCFSQNDYLDSENPEPSFSWGIFFQQVP